MWDADRTVAHQYPAMSLDDERQLIAQAQHGVTDCAQELVLRHVGFVRFRLRRKVFPHLLRRFGDDLLADAIPILYQKINTYRLDYCDRQGQPKPVRFVSYVWKRIDGFILDALQQELEHDRLVRDDATEDDPRQNAPWDDAAVGG